MDFVKKYRELNNKNSVQLKKEFARRGMTDYRYSNDELACDIVAYDAYHAGRSAAFEEARKNYKDTMAATAKVKERSSIVLKDEANDTIAFLKVTKDQKNLLEYLIDNDWLTDVSFTETKQIGWDEP